MSGVFGIIWEPFCHHWDLQEGLLAPSSFWESRLNPLGADFEPNLAEGVDYQPPYPLGIGPYQIDPYALGVGPYSYPPPIVR